MEDSDDEAELFDEGKKRRDRKLLPRKSKKEKARSRLEPLNRRHIRSRLTRSGTLEDEEPLPKYLKNSRQDEDDSVDNDLSTDREGGHTPVRDAITAQNSDLEDSKRCEKAIHSSHNATKGRKVLNSSQRQSNVEPENDAEDENYELHSKTRRDKSSSKTRDENLIREKPDHSSSPKDSGRRTGSRRQSPNDEEDDEQEKGNSDNQGLNGYGRDIDQKWLDSAWDRLKEETKQFFEQRLREAEMGSAPISEELIQAAQLIKQNSNRVGDSDDEAEFDSAWDRLNEGTKKILKEKAARSRLEPLNLFEQRLRQAEIRSTPIARELNAKLGLEPFGVSDNESGDKNDGGAQKERAENQCKEKLIDVPPQSSSDAGNRRRRAFCKEDGTKFAGGAQKVDILYYIILYYIILY